MVAVLWAIIGSTLLLAAWTGWLYLRTREKFKRFRLNHDAAAEHAAATERRAVERHAATHAHLAALGRDVRAGDAATHARMDRELAGIAGDVREVKSEQGGVRRGLAAMWGATADAFKDWLNKPKHGLINEGGSDDDTTRKQTMAPGAAAVPVGGDTVHDDRVPDAGAAGPADIQPEDGVRRGGSYRDPAVSDGGGEERGPE